MIPKIIHYCWFGGNPLPDELQAYIDTWRRFCPDYEIRLWDEKSFNVNIHPFTRTAYVQNKFAYVSDYVRAYALYEYGGIYLDTDVEIKESLDVFLSHEAFTGFEKKGSPFTALWGAIPKHSLSKKILEYYEGREYLLSQETNTKSVSETLISDFGINPNENLLQFGSDGINSIAIYPAEYFCLDLRPNYATHHFYGSWLSHEKRTFKESLHTQYYLEKAIYKEDKLNFSTLKSMSKLLTFKDICKVFFCRVYYVIYSFFMRNKWF